MFLTERKTPGSIGGGVIFPDLGGGNGGGRGNELNAFRGESGGEKLLKLWNPRSRCLVNARLGEEIKEDERGSSPIKVVGSRLSVKRESRSSTGS